MEPFRTHNGIAVPLGIPDCNTDLITPARYLKRIERTGYGDVLFDSLRHRADGSPNPDFVLNKPPYREGTILIAGRNFGCGSSREHAPWALQEYGFRVLIAPSFADIFYNNSLGIGLLPAVLAADEVDALFKAAEAQPGYRLRVSLPDQTVTTPEGISYHFDVEPFKKDSLLRGLDAIGLTEQLDAAIAGYEARRQAAAPWTIPA